MLRCPRARRANRPAKSRDSEPRSRPRSAGGQRLHPGRRQQDGQRHALHQAADADHLRQVVRRRLKARLHPPRASREELDGAAVLDPIALRSSARGRLGGFQRRHRVEMLALHVQPGPRGDQDLDPRRGVEELGHQARALQQVLKVVQDQEQAPVAQVVEQLLLGGGT